MSDFICEFCSKTFSQKGNCQRHKKTCKIKKEIDKNKTNETIKLIEEIQNLKQILVKKDEQIKFLLENKNQTNKVTNTNSNNNITINNIFANIDPIDFKSDESKFEFEQNFLNQHIDKGCEGLVKFLCEKICKNKIVTSDYARKIIQFKNKEEKIVSDPKGELLITTAIKENTDIIDKKVKNRHNYVKKQLNLQKFDDCPIDKDLFEKNRKINELIEIKDNIDNDNPINISPNASNIFVACGNITKNNHHITC